MTSSPFDFINSISSSKTNQLLDETLNGDEYNPFIVNRGLSLYQDCILYVQEMNQRAEIPKEAQYHFLHSMISKKRRWSKWPKRTLSKLDTELFEVLQERYRYSVSKCEEMSKLLTEDQKKAIIEPFRIPDSSKRTKNNGVSK